MSIGRTLAVLASLHDMAKGIAKAIVAIVMMLSVLVFSGETDKMWIPCVGVVVFFVCILAANRLIDD